MVGADLADTITTGDGGDILRGGGGADTLNSGGGTDYLVGGAGADAMTGGTGDDTYYVDDAGERGAEAVGEGNDIASTVSYALNELLGDRGARGQRPQLDQRRWT